MTPREYPLFIANFVGIVAGRKFKPEQPWDKSGDDVEAKKRSNLVNAKKARSCGPFVFTSAISQAALQACTAPGSLLQSAYQLLNSLNCAST